MNTKKYLLIVVWFTLAFVGTQYAWAEVQDVNIVDQEGQVKVKIKNNELQAIPTYQVAAKQLFQHSVDLEVDPGQLGAWDTLSIPAGKLLVIEFVSAQFGLPHDSIAVNLTLRTPLDGELSYHEVVLNDYGLIPSPLPNLYVASQQTKIYADTEVFIHFGKASGGDGGAGRVSISGYLVDKQ